MAAIEMHSHVVCIPYPSQSHIKAMLKLAKLLHHKGCHITFVNTEYNHKRFLRSRGPSSLDGLPDFKFETIPDGLPPSDADATQDLAALCESTRINCLAPFLDLIITKLNNNSDVPRVSCIVSDGFMTFSIDAAQELGIPVILSWTIAACGFMSFYQAHFLKEKGLTPLKDKSYLTNGYLDTVIDWIPGIKAISLRNLPYFIRTTDPNDMLLNFCTEAAQRAHKASANILHTFDALELDLVNVLTSMFPDVFTIGPLQLLLDQIPGRDESLSTIGYSLWSEESECLKWLDSKEPNSVVYANFGSIAMMKPEQLVEFGCGLANSNCDFVWIIRPDLVVEESASLPPEFKEAAKERGFIGSWCPQEQVLNHPAVGVFITHAGWNSIMESISAGVPMICWYFLGDQPTNCHYLCIEWEIGMAINGDNVRREQVEELVRELMGGEQGNKMKKKVMQWKELAEEATGPGGSSSSNLDKLVKHISTFPGIY